MSSRGSTDSWGRWVLLSSLVVCACDGGACDGGAREEVDGFNETDRQLLATMALTAEPVDRGNEWQHQPAAAALGQMLFFDQGLGTTAAGEGIACADCHSPRQAFSDPRARNNVSAGVSVTTRNSPGLLNVAFYDWFGWDGRSDALWAQGSHAYTSARTMAGTPSKLVALVRARYQVEYARAFGSVVPPITAPKADVDVAYRNILKAWGAYLSRLVSRNSPFDRFVLGDETALDAAQRRGLHLFIGQAGCIECHRGPHFSDGRFHNLGLAQRGDGVPEVDLGRETGLVELAKLRASGLENNGVVGVPMTRPEDTGAFRTKSLRNVSMTAPYFHAGQVATLRDVVWFYNRGGERAGVGTVSPFMVPLGLTDAEQADLEAFLHALDGDPVSKTLTCDPAVVPARRSTFESDVQMAFVNVLLLQDGSSFPLPYHGQGYAEVYAQPDGGLHLSLHAGAVLPPDYEVCPP